MLEKQTIFIALFAITTSSYASSIAKITPPHFQIIN